MVAGTLSAALMLCGEQPGEGRAAGSAPALGQTPTPALDELFGSSSRKQLAPKFSIGCSHRDLGVLAGG